jgi:hypothetical protein
VKRQTTAMLGVADDLDVLSPAPPNLATGVLETTRSMDLQCLRHLKIEIPPSDV